MSKTNTLESGLLDLILNNVNLANIGDATGLRGSSTAGSLYVSLHTADPGETGSQTTSETTYGAYARVAVSRSGGQWTVGTGSATNAGTITFPVNTSGTPTITHFGLGTASSGAGVLLYSGALTASRTLAVNDQPSFAAGAITVSED